VDVAYVQAPNIRNSSPPPPCLNNDIMCFTPYDRLVRLLITVAGWIRGEHSCPNDKFLTITNLDIPSIRCWLWASLLDWISHATFTSKVKIRALETARTSK